MNKYTRYIYFICNSTKRVFELYGVCVYHALMYERIHLFFQRMADDNLCNQIGPRTGVTKRKNGSLFFDTLMVFLK